MLGLLKMHRPGFMLVMKEINDNLNYRKLIDFSTMLKWVGMIIVGKKPKLIAVDQIVYFYH